MHSKFNRGIGRISGEKDLRTFSQKTSIIFSLSTADERVNKLSVFNSPPKE